MIRLIPFVVLVLTASTVVAQAPFPIRGSARSSTDVQGSAAAERARKTVVQFELLGQGPFSGVHAQEWAETFETLGADVRVRQPQAEDKLGVTEKTRGTLRWVTVTGTLDASGSIVLPDRQFSRADVDRLREWIDELKLYGAQGTPEGKPLWGLSNAQFQEIFAALSTLIPEDVSGKTLARAIQSMNLPEAYPVRFHSTAEAHLAQLSAEPVRQRVAGVSAGTGLAAALSDYGLGFRPLRTPEAEIELVVQPLADISDPWPVGWELKNETSRFELAPELFKMVPVQFDEIPLQEVFDEIARTTGRPILIDHNSVESKGINLAETTLSYPLKRVAWIQVIQSAAIRNRMTAELRIDERGQPFVRVTTFVPRQQAD